MFTCQILYLHNKKIEEVHFVIFSFFNFMSNENSSILLDKNVASELSKRIGVPNIITKYDVAEIKKEIIPAKRFVFDNFLPSIQDSDISLDDATISAGIDYIFGEQFHLGETYSIEGYQNVGKTRLCLKIALELAKVTKVLYVDSDANLSPPIIANIASVMSIDTDFPVYRDPRIPPTSTCCLTIANCLNHPDIINSINAYLVHSTPEVIIIDSLMSVYQNVVGKGSPGSAQLEELAIELKSIAKRHKCVVIVTNSIKSATGQRITYLGPQYGTLWHNRLHISTNNHTVANAEVICSPRLPNTEKLFYLEDMKPCESNDE